MTGVTERAEATETVTTAETNWDWKYIRKQELKLAFFRRRDQNQNLCAVFIFNFLLSYQFYFASYMSFAVKGFAVAVVVVFSAVTCDLWPVTYLLNLSQPAVHVDLNASDV